MNEVKFTDLAEKLVDTFIIEVKKPSSNISGLMNFLYIVVTKFNQVNNESLEQLYKSLFNFLLVEGLATTKMLNTRNSAFLLFAELIKRLNKFSQIANTLEIKNASWRTNKVSDWHISGDELEDNTREHVGLVNMGATCYVNAMIQQLFMLPEFRKEILEIKEKLEPGTPLYELQTAMAMLYQGKLRNLKTKKFYESMQIDIHVQRDASEFLMNLFEAVTATLRLTKKSRLIKNLFEIGTRTTIKCSSCNEISEVPATALMLSLAVKVNKSLAEGLDAFTSPETLEGDNSYFCEKCKKKVTAKKREQIESLPRFLLVQLKRFEQVYGLKNKKLNSYYKFPLLLNMEKYINDKCMYQLKGVVIHVGTLNSGHYYSLIKNNDHWIRFDDTNIEPFDPTDLENEAFGYEIEGADENSRNAYILLYKREHIDNETTMDDIKLSEELKTRLLEEHRDFMERQLVFAPGYDALVINLLANKEEIIEFALKYLVMGLLRSTMRNSMFEVTKYIESYMNSHIALNVIKLFCVEEIIKEFIISCPKDEARLCTFGILRAAIKVSKDESLLNLRNALIRQFNNLEKDYCGEYFRIMSMYVKLMSMKEFTLIGKTLTFLGIAVDMNWKGGLSVKVMNSDKELLIPIAEKCNTKISKRFNENLFDRQVEHIIDFLTELIKAYTEVKPEERPIDFVEIENLLRESNIKLLCAIGSKTEAGQVSIAKLFTELSKNKNYTNTLINRLIGKLNDFHTKELPAALKTVEFLLKLTNGEQFNAAIDSFSKAILTELKVNPEQYFTVVSYIDSFFKVLALYSDKFETLPDSFDSVRANLINSTNSWIKNNGNITKTKSLFRDPKEVIWSENRELISISNRAVSERKELIQGLIKKDFKNWNRFEFMELDALEKIKAEEYVDIYLYINILNK